MEVSYWQGDRMPLEDPKATLKRYLQRGRDALLWKLDGLSEYDVRRPMTPTGTNLLGLVKHVAMVEAGYLGATFDRPIPEPDWLADENADDDDNSDMWATAEQSRELIVGHYREVWVRADATIDALDLDAQGHVPWWPDERNPVTLHQILVHMISETERHAGQADIVRETLDGAVGVRQDVTNIPAQDPDWWATYRETLERVARVVGGVPD